MVIIDSMSDIEEEGAAAETMRGNVAPQESKTPDVTTTGNSTRTETDTSAHKEAETAARNTTVPETPYRKEGYRTRIDEDDFSISSIGTSRASKKSRKRGTRSHKKTESLPSGYERMSEIIKEAENLHDKARQEKEKTGNGTPNPTKTKMSVDDISKVIQERRKEVGAGIFKPRETGVVTHDFEATDRAKMDEEEADKIHLSDDEDQSPIDLSTISDLYQQQLHGKTTKAGGVLPFVILTKNIADPKDDWGIPDPPMFHDLIVELEMETMGDTQLSEVLDWTNFWGGHGVIRTEDREQGTPQRVQKYYLEYLFRYKHVLHHPERCPKGEQNGSIGYAQGRPEKCRDQELHQHAIQKE